MIRPILLVMFTGWSVVFLLIIGSKLTRVEWKYRVCSPGNIVLLTDIPDGCGGGIRNGGYEDIARFEVNWGCRDAWGHRGEYKGSKRRDGRELHDDRVILRGVERSSSRPSR